MPHKSTLRAVALVSLLVVATVSGPVAADTVELPGVDDNGFSATALETGGVVNYGAAPQDVVTYGTGGDVGWHVTLESADDYQALHEWANQSDSREVLSWDNESARAHVRAPATAVGTSYVDRLFDRGLGGQSYVVAVDVELAVGLPDRPEPMAADEFDAPNSLFRFGRGGFDQQGVAYSEHTNRSTMADVRDVTNVANVSETGDGVTIAVLDTGVNTANGQIYGNGTSNSTIRITAARNFVTDQNATAANNFANVSDGNGHGSWVASAIAANTTNASYDGVAPDATLVIGKTLDDGGSGQTSDIVDGIEWAAEEQGADIISMSLGSPTFSPAMAAAVEEAAQEHGALVVIAAGNSRQTVRWIASPADTHVEGESFEDGLMAVAATNTTNASAAGSAYFSQVGPDPAADGSNGASAGANPAIGAPGMSIETRVATQSGSVSYSTLSGTSMATPIVAGVGALVVEANPDLNGTTVEQRLGHAATPMPGAGVSEVGAGLVNASATTVSLPSDTDYFTDQREARSDSAEARDTANEAMGGGLAATWEQLGVV
jgi:subtilisin family serine protease